MENFQIPAHVYPEPEIVGHPLMHVKAGRRYFQNVAVISVLPVSLDTFAAEEK